MEFKHKTFCFPDSCLPSVRESQSPTTKHSLLWLLQSEVEAGESFINASAGKASREVLVSCFQGCTATVSRNSAFCYWASDLYAIPKCMYPEDWPLNIDSFIFDLEKLQIFFFCM